MKKVGKILLAIVIVCYVCVALTLTIFLLNYNEYQITVLGDKSFIIIDDDALEPDFKKGDLVVVTRNDNSEFEKGDQIFFYNGYEAEVSVNLGSVVDVTKVTDTETTFTVEGNLKLSSKYIIGKSETSKVYNNLGSTLSFLESKLGFLFVIIFPVLVLFIYLIYAVIMEIKGTKRR